MSLWWIWPMSAEPMDVCARSLRTIEDTVSSTGTAAMSSGTSMMVKLCPRTTPSTDTMPTAMPKSMDPESPMNTLAGWKL